jgi:hypothetical protein
MRSNSRHFAVAEFVRIRAVAAEFVRIRAMVRRRADGVGSPQTAQRSSALPLFGSSALPLFRSSALPLFRSSALPLFRSSALPLALRAFFGVRAIYRRFPPSRSDLLSFPGLGLAIGGCLVGPSGPARGADSDSGLRKRLSAFQVFLLSAPRAVRRPALGQGADVVLCTRSPKIASRLGLRQRKAQTWSLSVGDLLPPELSQLFHLSTPQEPR